MFVSISNFRCVLNVVCFILGDSPASEFYMPTFWNSVCSVFIGSVSRKNNRVEIVWLFIWETFWHESSLSQSEGGWQVRVEKQAVEGNNPQVEVSGTYVGGGNGTVSG